jgi:hypothetical protein
MQPSTTYFRNEIAKDSSHWASEEASCWSME